MNRPNWFIALPAPPLPGAAVEALFAGCPPELRRFAPADLHVTVAFLGAVDTDRARGAWRMLGDTPPDDGPFTVGLGTLRPFGRRNRPSAFAFELADGDGDGDGDGAVRVAALIERWRNPLRLAAGLPAETRPVRPHMTVARPRRQAPAAVREAALRWACRAAVPAVTLTLDRLALYTWSAQRRQRLFDIVDVMTLNRAG